LRQLALDFPESRGFSTEDSLHPVEGSELGSVFKTGKPFVLRTQADVMSEWSAYAVRAESIESGCALPLISRNRTLGVLTLCSRVEHAFSPEDVDFLMRAAGQVAIAVENALAYREIPFFSVSTRLPRTSGQVGSGNPSKDVTNYKVPEGRNGR